MPGDTDLLQASGQDAEQQMIQENAETLLNQTNQVGSYWHHLRCN